MRLPIPAADEGETIVVIGPRPHPTARPVVVTLRPNRIYFGYPPEPNSRRFSNLRRGQSGIGFTVFHGREYQYRAFGLPGGISNMGPSSMSLSKESIRPLLKSLATSSQFEMKGLYFKKLEEASFSEPTPGYAIWRWGEIVSSDRGKLTFIFDDGDGTGVFITVVAAADNSVREIEFWRGDGKPAQRVPLLEELVEPVPGRIYGPGGSIVAEDGIPEQS